MMDIIGTVTQPAPIAGVLAQPVPIVGVTSDGSSLATTQANLAAASQAYADAYELWKRTYLGGY
jgi:hypothetical protein